MGTQYQLSGQKMAIKIASALLCFNRPDYIKVTLKSLERSVGNRNLDWFVFQDGAENKISGKIYATEEQLNSVREIINKSTLPIKDFIKNDENKSPSQQRYLALSLLDSYDLLFVFEDDMIVGKHYIKLLIKMSNQFPNYIGSLYNHKSVGNNFNIVRLSRNARLWGHYINKKVYNKIKPAYTDYYNVIKTIDYHQRTKSKIKLPKSAPWIMDDVVINKLCRKNGIFKLRPDVTRGKYIGKNGMVAYKTERAWKKMKMHLQPDVITFEEDKYLKRFILK